MVTDKNVIAQLSEASPYAHCAKEAPVVFVSCYRSEGLHSLDICRKIVRNSPVFSLLLDIYEKKINNVQILRMIWIYRKK